MPELVVGLKELGDNINLLDQKLQRKIVRTAAMAGIEVFRKDAIARAPRRTDDYEKTDKGGKKRGPGFLKKNIKRRGKPLPDGGFEASTGPNRRAWYGSLVERGFTHQAGKRSGRGRPNAAHNAATGKHVPGKPFMRPAFDTKQKQAEQVFADEIKKGLNEEGFHL
jgi:HK97 gp10 family phage protein